MGIARVGGAVSHTANFDLTSGRLHPHQPALAVERTGKGWTGYPKLFGGVRNGQARGFDDLRPDEIAEGGFMGTFALTTPGNDSLALGQHTLAFERFVQQRLDVGLVWQPFSLGEALRQRDVGLRQSDR